VRALKRISRGMAATAVPRFRASEVAALIGRNRYRPAESALLVAMNNNARVKDLFAPAVVTALASPMVRLAINRIEPMRMPQFSEVTASDIARLSLAKAQPTDLDVERVAANLQTAARTFDERRVESVALSQAAASEATRLKTDLTTEAVVKVADAARDEVAAELVGAPLHAVQDARLAASAGVATKEQVVLVERVAVARDSPVANEAAHVAASKAAETASLSKHREAAQLMERAEHIGADVKVLQTLAKPEETRKIVTHGVTMQRGALEEKARLDDIQLQQKVLISERNNEVKYLDTPYYSIAGKRDGKLDDGRGLVELKLRRNWFKTPPAYDIVQVRVYLRLFGEKRGVLIEQKQDGLEHRETVVEDSEREWTLIDTLLRQCAFRMKQMTPEEVLRIAQLVEDRQPK